MISFNTSYISQQSNTGILIRRHLTVQGAADVTGDNIQYLRRLLRSGKLECIKIGQLWLIEMQSLEKYLQDVESTSDRRYRGEISFPHALRKLTATEYSRIHSPTYAGTPRFCNWLAGSRPLSITNFHGHNDTVKNPIRAKCFSMLWWNELSWVRRLQISAL